MRRAHGVWLLLAFGVWLLPAGCTSDVDGAGQTPDSGSSDATGGRASGGSAGKAGSTAAGGASASGGVAGSGTAGSGTAGGGTAGSGTGGTAGRDAATDGPAADTGTADPCKTARFCEDFESFAVGAPPNGVWTARTNRGAVSVVTDQKQSGAKSAKFTTEMNASSKTAYIRLASTTVFPMPGNVLYGRMMFRLESAPETAVHWTFIQASGLVAPNYTAIYRYGGQHPVTQGATFVGNQLMANYETSGSAAPASDCWHHANKRVVPVGRWACAEWQFEGPANTQRMWLDGAALDDLTVQGKGQGCVSPPATQTWVAPTFGSLELGWESYQSDAARTLYIDDVVLDTKRIGCPAVTQ